MINLKVGIALRCALGQNRHSRIRAVAKRKNEVDESLQRYFGVADWAVNTDEASKLWDITEKMLAS